MAGHIDVDNALEEGRRSLLTLFNNLEDLIFDKDNDVQPSAASPAAIPSKTDPRDALVTAPPYVPLEPRQTNPQDCSNLIAASVDRATVEISRTIIALNATFSQQLQQASIDKTNGIRSANNSATSTISVISSSASVVTSSAFSSLTLANLAVNTAQAQLSSAQLSASTISSSLDLANLALTSVSSASASDVSTLSASLSVLQASVLSVQSSASAAIAAAQAALVSATGSAAAQASSILASAAQNSPGRATSTSSTSPALLPSATIFLTPAQIAAIVVGAVVGSFLLSFLLYLVIIRMKRRKERDSYLDEKGVSRSPTEMDVPSRLSSTFRTGNAMTIKFNPPQSSDAPPPGQPKLRRVSTEEPVATSSMVERMPEPSTVRDVRASTSRQTTWISGFNFNEKVEDPFKDPAPATTWPLATSATTPTPVITPPVKKRARETQTFHFFDLEQTLTRKSKVPSKLVETMSIPSSDGDSGIEIRPPSPDPKPAPEPEEVVENPFLDVPPEKETADPFEDPVVVEGEEPTEAVQDPAEEWIEEEVQTPIQGPTKEATTPAIEESIDEQVKVPIESTVEDPLQPPIEQQPQPEISLTLTNLEQLLPQQSTRKPSPETLALLNRASVEEQGRNSTMPEIDALLRRVAQQNEHVADKPLFWTDFRAPDLEVERALSPTRDKSVKRTTSPLMGVEFPREEEERVLMVEKERIPSPIPVREASLETKPSPVREVVFPQEEEPMMNGQRETTLSPLHRRPSVGLEPDLISPKPELAQFVFTEPEPEAHEPPPPPSIETGEREISPLRMNPQIRSITSLLAQHDAEKSVTEGPPEPEENERQQRGRSMIRTSDLIEARLSAIAQARNSQLEPIRDTLTTPSQPC
ncbi:uncharacterized protein PAC_08701 [Phialocephala subalpina]|uniref:Uncharacterized protein n=1 Tax=Phialocephala subalpina TaxID=576137 RepID=A0A1L7X1C3_9HELO|nr:uncharacterized protein PAC_08701 [Phialocephala subalpina]